MGDAKAAQQIALGLRAGGGDDLRAPRDCAIWIAAMPTAPAPP